MLIIPAIDLRGGRCVQLVQGRFDAETAFDDDPARVARRWAELGAQWIHVVDLDGARSGKPVQLDLVREIVSVGVPVQLGGGLRDLPDLELAFEAGVTRVILGTAAIERPKLMRAATEWFGAERVLLGVDARQGRVAVRAWEQTSDVSALDVVEQARQSGITRVIYTDIERDGTLTSPNYTAVEEVARSGVDVIASGGVGSREHLERLAVIDRVDAAIVGTALYVGSVEITDEGDWIVDPRRAEE